MTFLTNAGPSLSFLVVEDDTIAAIDLECILEDMGHLVTAVAVAPAMAARTLAAHGPRIDAVIFGATLVGLPPYALGRSLSEMKLPAIVTSPYTEEFVRVLGFRQPYLGKPFTREGVARAVRRVVGQDVASAA